jgi:hypothetical protein
MHGHRKRLYLPSWQRDILNIIGPRELKSCSSRRFVEVEIVSPGEINDVIETLPEEIRMLWPREHAAAQSAR